MEPLVAGNYPRLKRTRKRDYVKGHICSFLETSKRDGKIGEPLRAIIAYVHSKAPNAHYQTTINGLRELVKEGRVEKVPGVRGYYRLVENEEAS